MTVLPYEEASAAYDPVLGLEVHVELNTLSKMFCGCSTAFGAEPEYPGLRGSASAARLAAGGERKGGRVGHPDRAGPELHDCRSGAALPGRNYFYPDHAEELSDLPVRRTDRLRRVDRSRPRRESYRIGIERAHMEEDTGKSLHVGGVTGRITAPTIRCWTTTGPAYR
jgi:aspartyl-tRNA(Asn)/glutamyl-tRNA(Gln) amidotransferase subunit B